MGKRETGRDRDGDREIPKDVLGFFPHIFYSAGRYQAPNFKFVHVIARARNKQMKKKKNQRLHK